MPKKNGFFSEIYTIDKSTNLYMVEIALDQYTDIFNSWDPAPFKRREIDPDLAIYLEGSSNEIPFRYPIELYFTVPPGRYDNRMEAEARQGLKTSLGFKLYFLRKELKKTNTQMLLYIVMGFGFLWSGTVFADRFTKPAVLSLLAEGLFIGGWVFLWEAVSLFFFTNLELYQRYRTYQRLQQAPVIFGESHQA